MHIKALLNVVVCALAHPAGAMYLVYLTGQHDVVPELSLTSEITHVALAFMRSEVFNDPSPSEWPLFTSVPAVRSRFAHGTAVMIAIGGWGDTNGFSEAAKTSETRKRFAANVAHMVEDTGADGVDIDWEYPGGNGEDYKMVSNKSKGWEVDAYPKLLADIREALGPSKLMSAAVPGLERDMIAFTNVTVPHIAQTLNFTNIMTYDLMNRRDSVTKHHTGLSASLNTVEAYLKNGLPPQKANLGFAFYVKWFKLDPTDSCDAHPIGCRTVLMEDEAGRDLGQAGGFSWHDQVPREIASSFAKAMEYGSYDEVEGGHYYLDHDEDIFWSWEDPASMARKFHPVIEKKGLGGVFAWGLGEDAPDFLHLKALNLRVKGDTWVKRPKDEL